MRVLELYCGIGGCAAALGGAAAIVGAFDINTLAIDVHRHNFGDGARARLVDGLPSEELARLQADLWWLSPPCQPFTRRGHRRDLDDPRAATFRAALRHLQNVRPAFVALENVEGFEISAAHGELLGTLERAGYAQVQERLLCPSALGWPNRRPRYYLAAARDAGLRDVELKPQPATLADLIDPANDHDHDLVLDPTVAERYAYALHVVESEDAAAITATFTAAYGRSHVRSGSYLRREDGRLRRFAPAEVLRLLGFPATYTFPPNLTRANAWRLAGNSLSLPAVREVLRSIPGLS
jgi:DNA (cytosine-5)-methyltransferase 1